MLKQTPHYLVVGASSLTGKALAKYLSYNKYQYSISDNKPQYYSSVQLELNPQNLPINIYQEEIQAIDQLTGITNILIAPGVPRTIPLLLEAKKQNIPIDGEISFTLNILERNNKTPEIVGITGSLGKSTTSFITYQILKAGYTKGNVYLLGNFGTPFCSIIETIHPDDIVVLELSSYHCEDAEKYRIPIVSVLNISPNHLDRYESFTDYKAAKEKIFLNQQKNDIAILNTSLPYATELKDKIHSHILSISTTPSQESLFYLDEKENICYKNNLFLEKSQLLLKGSHILENMCVALAISYHIGINPEIQKSVLKDFKGLEHRSEFVRNIHNITFINDSKATTPFAIIPNLKSVDYGNIVLIVGGKNKNLDFSILLDYLKYVKYIVYYGVSGKEIQTMLPFDNSSYIYDFKEAVELAYQKAKIMNLQTVLLSTGCASFDQFQSYEHRGQVYKKIVNELI